MSNASVIEAMLLRWGEGPTGRTVTLLLPDDTPHHPFKGLRSGPSNGQRLGCAFTLINDDETTTPVEPPSDDEGARLDQIMPPNWRESLTAELANPPSTAPEKPKGGGDKRPFTELPNATQAALACRRMAFRRWLAEDRGGADFVIVGLSDEDPNAVATADAFLKSHFAISSKRQLDSDPDHKARWPMFYGLFQDWLNE